MLFNPTIPLLGIPPLVIKTSINSDTQTRMFIAALLVVVKINVDDKERLKNLYNRTFCSHFKD